MPEIIKIPIFPLPNVVLFPKTYLPLHIYEPRYRQMVKETIEGDNLIGMNLLQVGWEKDYYGNPLIFETGCAGKITEVEPLEDGRYNIMLYGLSKYRVKKQSFTKPYRIAEVEFINRMNSSTGALPLPMREELLSVLKKYSKHIGDQGEIESLINELEDDESLVHSLSFALNFNPLEKQYLLETKALQDQCRKLIDLIQFQLHNKPAWVSTVLDSHRKN